MLQASSFSTFYMCLLSLKLCIMNVEINKLNWSELCGGGCSSARDFVEIIIVSVFDD